MPLIHTRRRYLRYGRNVQNTQFHTSKTREKPGEKSRGHQPVWILQAGRGTGKPDTNSQRGGKAAWLPGDMLDENQDAVRAHFFKIYSTLIERKTNDAKLPPSILEAKNKYIAQLPHTKMRQ